MTDLRQATSRREQILTVAARLFRERSFHGVGVDDIGAAVGITGPAIYRHFKNKQYLLATIVERSLSQLAEDLSTQLDAPPTLDQLCELTVRACLRDRDLMAAYTRDSHSLPRALRARVSAQQALIAEFWYDALAQVQPLLAPDEPRYRIAAATGIALLPISYDPPLPQLELHSWLTGMMMAALLAPVDAHSPLLRPRTAPGTTRATTPRDRVLDEAIRLFRQHGYAAVSVEAIGTAAGLDQSSVYRHYTGKDEILATALEAGATRLDAGVSALKSAVSPAEELELLVASYVDTALADRDLIAVWLAEAGHLTGDASRRARARQRAYIAVWERAMRTRWPQLAPAEAALTTRAVLSLVNACVSLRRHRGLTNDRLRQLLTAMSFACLSWGGEGRGRHRRTRISALDLVDPDRPANARHA